MKVGSVYHNKLDLVGFLEVINRMLVGMDASSLFLEEERDTIVNDMQQEVIDAGLDGSREAILRSFSQKAARNLHVILAMSPVRLILKISFVSLYCRIRSNVLFL